MSKTTQRLRKAAKKVATRAGAAIRRAEKIRVPQGHAAQQRKERPLAFEIGLPLAMDTAIARVTDALKAEGFGILTRIDASEVFLEKLGVAFRAYTILGACNPSLAFRALTARPEAGLLLPCNVTVESLAAGGCLVRIADPVALLEATGLKEDAEVRVVATEAAKHLERAAQWLREHGHAAIL